MKKMDTITGILELNQRLKDVSHETRTNIKKTLQESEKVEKILRKRFEIELNSFHRSNQKKVTEMLELEEIKKKVKHPIIPTGPIKPLVGMSFTEQLAAREAMLAQKGAYGQKPSSPLASSPTSNKIKSNMQPSTTQSIDSISTTSPALLLEINTPVPPAITNSNIDDEKEIEIALAIRDQTIQLNRKISSKIQKQLQEDDQTASFPLSFTKPNEIVRSVIDAATKTFVKKKVMAMMTMNKEHKEQIEINKENETKMKLTVTKLKSQLPPPRLDIDESIRRSAVKVVEAEIPNVVSDSINAAITGVDGVMEASVEFISKRKQEERMVELRKKAVDRVRHRVIKARKDAKKKEEQEEEERKEREARRKLKSLELAERSRRDEIREQKRKLIEAERDEQRRKLKEKRDRQRLGLKTTRTNNNNNRSGSTNQEAIFSKARASVAARSGPLQMITDDNTMINQVGGSLRSSLNNSMEHPEKTVMYIGKPVQQSSSSSAISLSMSTSSLDLNNYSDQLESSNEIKRPGTSVSGIVSTQQQLQPLKLDQSKEELSLVPPPILSFTKPHQFESKVEGGDVVWMLSANEDGTLAKSEVFVTPAVSDLEKVHKRKKEAELAQLKRDGWYASTADNYRASYFKAQQRLKEESQQIPVTSIEKERPNTVVTEITKVVDNYANNSTLVPINSQESREVGSPQNQDSLILGGGTQARSPSQKYMSSAAKARLNELDLEILPEDSEQLVTDLMLNIKSRMNPKRSKKMSVTETKLVYSPFAKAFRLNKLSSQEKLKLKRNGIKSKSKGDSRSRSRSNLDSTSQIDINNDAVSVDYTSVGGSSTGFLFDNAHDLDSLDSDSIGTLNTLV